MSPTIAPDVLVSVPIVDSHEGWEIYRQDPKDIVQGGEYSKHKEPPMYTRAV